MTCRFARSRIYTLAACSRRECVRQLHQLHRDGLVLLERAIRLRLIDEDEYVQFAEQLQHHKRRFVRNIMQAARLVVVQEKTRRITHDYTVIITALRTKLYARECALAPDERLERTRLAVVTELQSLHSDGVLTNRDYDATMATALDYHQVFLNSLQGQCSSTQDEITDRFLKSCYAAMMNIVYRVHVRVTSNRDFPARTYVRSITPPCHRDEPLQRHTHSLMPWQSATIGVL